MIHSRRLHRTAGAWVAIAALSASASALAFDSGGPERGNVTYTQRAYQPIAGDSFTAGNCGITYHPLDVDKSSCNTAWAKRNGALNYTSKVFHSAYANLTGDYTDPGGMPAQILVCPRSPPLAASPPTDLSQCQPTAWNTADAVSGVGWVKARRAWDLPAVGEWHSFVTPEHMLITQAAATLAGFDATTLMSRPFWVRYPTHGDYVSSPWDANRYFVSPSYIPAKLSEAGAEVTRAYYLPELAQLPDASFSVYDWAAGNETCPVPGVAATSAGGDSAFGNGTSEFDVNTCHEFGKLLGTINTSHFKSSSQLYWTWYHGLAVQRMGVCSTMAQSLAPYLTSTDTAAQNTEVHECEREAMVFEMFAQHFLQDAWSTGHMWMRWGSPELNDYPATYDNPPGWTALFPHENLAARRTVHAAIIGAASGMIHGTKAISQGTVVGYIPFASDDPLCAPKMHLPWIYGVDFDTEWTSGNAVFPGAGDYYWAPSPSFQEPSISGDATFKEQRTRLLGCSARSMRDVYQAGPRLHGALGASQTIEGQSLDSIDPSSDYCWGQWATNKSMLGALAPYFISRWLGGAGLIMDLASPYTNLLVLNKLSGGFKNLDQGYLASLLILFSGDWVTSTQLLQLAFTLNLVTDGANGTQSAQLEGPLGTLDLLGVKPNHIVTPGTGGMLPSSYSDRTGAPRADETQFPQDRYVQRMFRRSHLADTCGESTPDVIAALRQQCIAAAPSGGDPEACTACVEATEPHIPLASVGGIGASKCGALLAEAGAYPSQWSDPTWRARPLGAFGTANSSAFDEAVMYCTGTDRYDWSTWGLAESRDYVLSQTISSEQRVSMCVTPATALTPETPLYTTTSQQQVAIVRFEGDPSFQGPGPIVNALQVTQTPHEQLVGDNTCKSYFTTSLDDIVQSEVSPFPLMFNTASADQALIGNPWFELDVAMCGPQQRYTLWNRTCAEVVPSYPALASTIDLTPPALGFTGGRATKGWGYLDSSFPNNAGGAGSDTNVPEARCAIAEPRKYDRTCRTGSVCGSSNLCVPELTHPLKSSYLSYWGD